MYFCKNCGEQYQTDEAVLCVKCGVSKGVGNNYCHHCGKPVTPDTAVCLSCGVPCNATGAQLAGNVNPNAKSKLAAGLLGIFLGYLGVHNFYLGYTQKAVIQLVLFIVGILTLCIGVGFFMYMAACIWGLVEGIMILCGKIEVDGQGNPLKE